MERLSRSLALAFLVAVMALARLASAQGEAVVPPRSLEANDVPYPEGASGDAEVILELVVDREGKVQDARIVEGSEPFAAATLAAARGFRFEPARRGDIRIPARIRMRIGFSPRPPEPPPAPLTPPEGSSKTPPALSPMPPGKALPGSSPGPPPPRTSGIVFEEVEVRGARKEAGKTTLGQAEIRDLPGAFGDAFRAIETLPGVVPIASGLPFFFVRGAPPGNTGYFLDGVRVPLLYHLAFGPSVVHPGLVERAEFWPGGFPARFGRFAGGILSGETREPATRPRGEGNVRLFDAGALVEAPFAGGRGTVLAGGRYSYTAALFSLFVPETRLDYWDYQARATFELTPEDRVSVFAFGSHDFLGERKVRRGGTEPETKTLFETDFHRLDLRYDRKIEGGRLRTGLTFGLDSSTFDEERAVRDRMVSTRVELERRLSRDILLRAGADAFLDHYDLVSRFLARGRLDTFSSLYPPRNDLALGVRADLVWKLSSRVEVVPGARVDLFGSVISSGARGSRSASNAAIPSMDPRFATRVRLSPAVTWVSTFGVSHQPPAFLLPVPGLQIGRLGEGLQTSIQESQGAEIALPLRFTLSPTVFLAQTFGLTDATSTCPDSDDILDRDCSRRVRGRTFGLEMMLKRSFSERLSGFVSYTLSRSTRFSGPVTVGARGGLGGLGGLGRGMEVSSEFDRTHVLNVIGAYDLGRGWRAGLRFFFYTGRPYTERNFRGVPLPPFNGHRYPDFYRFDARLEKRWTLGRSGHVALVFEWLNATLRKEALSVDCGDDSNSEQVCAPEEIGPITIPSLGVEGGF